EDLERMRRIAIRGAALAAAGLALRHRQIIGDRIHSAEIWEKSEYLVMDWIETTREKSQRLIAALVRNHNNEIVGVRNVEIIQDDGTEATMTVMESGLSVDSDESA